MFPSSNCRLIAVSLCLSLSFCVTAQQQAEAPLDDQRVMQLVKGGIHEDELERMIASAPQVSFLLNPASTDVMLKAGVSEDVIKAMSARQNGSSIFKEPSTKHANFTAVDRSNRDGSHPQFVTASAFTAGGTYNLTYDGGSIANLKTGTGMKLHLDQNQIRIVKDNAELISVPASAVTEISYGQDVHRRVGAAIGLAVVSFGVGALMALTKSKKHFIGLTWDDAGNKGGAAFQANKNDYRGVLAGLEGITGKKAVNSDTMTVKN
jgi:hypothetical protein